MPQDTRHTECKLLEGVGSENESRFSATGETAVCTGLHGMVHQLGSSLVLIDA